MRTTIPKPALNRLTLHAAALAFGVDRGTLRRKLTEAGIDARTFTIREVHEALTTREDESAAEIRKETLLKITAERKYAEIKTARRLGELLPTDVAVALMAPMAIAIRQRILGSSMSDAEKDDLLSELYRLGEIDWEAEAQKAALKP